MRAQVAHAPGADRHARAAHQVKQKDRLEFIPKNTFPNNLAVRTGWIACDTPHEPSGSG